MPNKKIVQLNKKTNEQIKVWNSLVEAGKTLDIDPNCIMNCCRGRVGSAGGFCWIYEDITEASKFIKHSIKHGGHNVRAVVRVDPVTGDILETYKSTADCAQKHNTRYPFIIGCCAKRASSVKGMIFRYQDSYNKEEFLKENIGSYNCLICSAPNKTLKGLATHIQFSHKISSEEYTTKYILKLQEAPRCLAEGCLNIPRYSTYKFLRYCSEHAYIAESEAGKIGGTIKKSWNKGKTKLNDVRLLNQSIVVSGPRNHFYGKHHTEETREHLTNIGKLTQEEWLNRINARSSEFELIAPTYEAYTIRQHMRLTLKCKKCNNIQKKNMVAFERGSLCIFCFSKMTSKAELAIGDYIEKELGVIDIERNNRIIISPKELDIYVPSKQLAIEYNGLYWHMLKPSEDKHHKESSSLDNEEITKNAALIKTELCQERNIQLLHIFSDEWLNKEDLLKSMISSRLGLSKNNVNARECSIKEIIDHKEEKEFFNRTHISGYTRSRICYALIDEKDNKIVSLLSAREPHQKKKYNASHTLELARFSSELNTNVRGGFSRLLTKIKEYCLNKGYARIISYCDLRYGTGKVYLNNGFNVLTKNTGVNYWYTDGLTRFNRFKYRAQPNKPEKIVAEEADVCKVYGCGNALYEYNLQQPQQENIVPLINKDPVTIIPAAATAEPANNHMVVPTKKNKTIRKNDNSSSYGGTKPIELKLNDSSNFICAAKNILLLDAEQREQLVQELFEHFRKGGFPYPTYNKEILLEEWKKLHNIDSSYILNKENNALSNKNVVGHKLIQHFCSKTFYETSSDKQRSMIEAFNDDNILLNVLRNRVVRYGGYFNMHGAMLRQGFRSTRSCATTSTFNCLISKFIYQTFSEEGDWIYDYSSGFGQRMIGALALKNRQYVGCDPWKENIDSCNNMIDFIRAELNDIHIPLINKPILINTGSELYKPPENKQKFSLAFSSPPYFTKEIYDKKSLNQSTYNRSYQEWLNDWWDIVTQNVDFMLKEDGTFIVNMIPALDNKPILDDMLKVCNKYGWHEVDRYYINMSQSHMIKYKKPVEERTNFLYKNEPIVIMKKI